MPPQRESAGRISVMDLTAIAAKGLKGASQMLLKDLEAIPEDCFDNSFGGKSRTIADLIFEVNLVNDHVGMVIRGEEPFPWPEGDWIKAPADFRTKAVVIDAFQKSSDRAIATAEAFSQEEIE